MLIVHAPHEYTKGAALSCYARHCSMIDCLRFMTAVCYSTNREILDHPLQLLYDLRTFAELLRLETSNNSFMIVFRPFCLDAFILDSRSILKKKCNPPDIFNITGNSQLMKTQVLCARSQALRFLRSVPCCDLRLTSHFADIEFEASKTFHRKEFSHDTR